MEVLSSRVLLRPSDFERSRRFYEEVWNNGTFSGDYAHFHKAIVTRMPPTQSPNHFQVGVSNPVYDAQTPFRI